MHCAKARARAALAVAACDQQSLDGGSWLGALAAFSNRKPSHLASIDSYRTRIYEARWSELCLHKVRELGQHLEAKRKLGGKGRSSLATALRLLEPTKATKAAKAKKEAPRKA